MIVPPRFYLVPLAVLIASCSSSPPSPDALARKIARQICELDPKGAGVFFEGSQQLDEQNLVISYRLSRQEDPDDPWAQKREVHFIFHPAPDDPEAPEGWYLAQVTGNYLERLSLADGLQLHWDYQFYQTANGSRQGIIGLAGMQQVAGY